MGIGVDALPGFIKNSSVLTGNDLGQLANMKVLPNQTNVDKFIADNPKFIGIKLNEKHKFAKVFFKKSDVKNTFELE